MDTLPLHPSIVHIPIALAILMPVVAGGILVAWWAGKLDRKAWVIALGLQAVLVGGAFAALETGETDEERAEAVAPESAIEAHEEAAEQFTWAAVAVLILFAAAALLPGDATRKLTALAAVLGTLVILGLGVRVGHAGGELTYRYGAAAAHADGGTRDAAASFAAERQEEHEREEEREDDD